MSFTSDQSRNDYLELLEELRNLLSDLKEHPSITAQKPKYEDILQEMTLDFQKPLSFNNPFQIKDMLRIVNYPYQKIPLSIRGSEISNGRFHHISNGPQCLYLSSSEETAQLETKVSNEEVLLNKVIKSPKSTFYFCGKLQNILDLRTRENAERHGIYYELIFDDWQDLNIVYSLKSYTQRIAKKAFEFGYEGLLYQSAKHSGGYNLVVFSENLMIDSFLSLQGDDFTLQDIKPNHQNLYGYLPNILD